MYGCRWQPSGDGVNVFHSTANEANMEGRSAIDNAKAEALVEGYSESKSDYETYNCLYELH